MKRLREVIPIVGMTRRVIQGYEKAGVAAPSARDKYGRLLYDDSAVERLLQIRLYKDIGLDKNEMLDIFDAPSSDRSKEIIEKHINNLTKEKEKIENMINVIKKMQSTGIIISDLRIKINGLETANYDELLSYLVSLNGSEEED